MTNIEVEMPCPHCRQKFPLPLEEMRAGEDRACPHCGATITFSGADGSKIQKALDELKDQAAGISTKVKINIKKRRQGSG